MLLDLPAWAAPEAAIALRIVTTILIGVITWLLVVAGIKGIVKAAESRARAHDAARPGRLGQALSQATGMSISRAHQRTKTLASILRSVAGFVIGGMTLLTVLATLGMPLGPVLASAGVGGVALGFGAQSLVKDFLSGMAMIVEDQYGVGDYIDTGEVSGTVEEISLRVTRLRDASGKVWYVRNGEITRIGNHSQGWSTAMVDIPVSYDEDPSAAQAVLQGVVDQIDLSEPWAAPLLERPVVLGVESVAGATMTLRIMLKTAPNEHWSVTREIRLRAKDALATAGIKGPNLLPGL